MFSLLQSEPTANAKVVTEAGRQFYVVPVTTIVPGVLPGSKGPGLYESADIANDYKQWDGIPAVVYHPSAMGNNVSAQHRGILKRSCVGFLKNTRLREDGSLQHEIWVDAKRAQKVDRRVFDAVKNGTKMEVSTGLYTDQVPVTGNYNGKDYTWKAKNFIADHLAILPDQRGACSLEDGCGLNVNEWTEEARQAAVMTREQHAKAAKKHLKAALYASAETKDDVAKSHTEAADVRKTVANSNPNHDAKGLFTSGIGNDDPELAKGTIGFGIGGGTGGKSGKAAKVPEDEGEAFMKALSGIQSAKWQQEGNIEDKNQLLDLIMGRPQKEKKTLNTWTDAARAAALAVRQSVAKAASAVADKMEGLYLGGGGVAKAHMSAAKAHKAAGNDDKAADHMSKALDAMSKTDKFRVASEEALDSTLAMS